MRYRSLPFVLFTILFACSGLAYGQGFNYDAYEPRTIADLIKKYDNPDVRGDQAKKRNMIFGAAFPSQVIATYTSSSRQLTVERKDFLDAWAKVHNLKPEISSLFETEYLFTENSVEYWLPVQKQVAAYFGKELQKGDPVTLFLVMAGGKKIEGKWEWIMLVNEFQK